jgi:acetylornithine deacetylase/succinyl-diaminopimelate desuccinylase-like protein
MTTRYLFSVNKEIIMRRAITAIVVLYILNPVVLDSQTLSKKEFLTEIRNYREKNRHFIIKEFFELLSIPNVSADKENIRKNAEFIRKMMENRGIEARIMETGGNPMVYGELKVPDATRTLVFYAHYDGQPVDPSKWTDTEPFQPALRPGKMEAGSGEPKPIPMPLSDQRLDDDWRIYARSSSDDKAAVIALLNAVDAIKSTGIHLKNNIKFIFEGEEEIGSPNLRSYLEKHKYLLKSDILFMCDGPVYYTGAPTLFFGVRGIVMMEITVFGPNTNIHSGHYGNWAPNPAMRLAQLLATMKDATGNVTIKGFYDACVPLTEVEQKALKAVPPYDDSIMKLYGFSNPEGGGLTLLEALQLPSLNIHGLRSGWVGGEARTIVPNSAIVSIDIRLAKGNEASDLIQKVINHTRAQGFHIVQEDPDQKTRMTYPLIAKLVTTEEGYRAYRTSMDLPLSRRVLESLSEHSDSDPVVIPSLGGSLPIYIFSEILDVPAIGVPIANHDNNQHQPNENMRIGHLWQGIETFAALMLLGDKE